MTIESIDVVPEKTHQQAERIVRYPRAVTRANSKALGSYRIIITINVDFFTISFTYFPDFHDRIRFNFDVMIDNFLPDDVSFTGSIHNINQSSRKVFDLDLE